MSAADTAVQSFHKLEPRDLRTLLAIEHGMNRFQYIPDKVILKLTRFSRKELSYRFSRLDDFGLIRRWAGPYKGYMLNTAGYDCLAINAHVKASVLKAFGKSLGVGKEADVYDALTPDGGRVAIKFHRLGRISFHKTRIVRGYTADHHHISWLHRSRHAAEKEMRALKLVYPCGISVPEPINQNRHTLVMGMIEGAELFHYSEIPNPNKVLKEILFNTRKALLEAEVIHADLSEFNVVIKSDWHILIIDWPQFVKKDHPNADILLRRDIKNILRFFQRKFRLNTEFVKALSYVKGHNSKM